MPVPVRLGDDEAQLRPESVRGGHAIGVPNQLSRGHVRLRGVGTRSRNEERAPADVFHGREEDEQLAPVAALDRNGSRRDLVEIGQELGRCGLAATTAGRRGE